MGPLQSRDDRHRDRSWGAVARGTAAVGPSTDSHKKKILVQTQEYLPHKPTFTFAISKSQSQGCRARFAYQVEVTGKKEFWLTVVRRDQQQGWEHDLHVRWEAGGSMPTMAVEEDGPRFDDEIAQMVAMGYNSETARRALMMKEGDLGAAASFIGACDLADQMPADDARGTSSNRVVYLPKRLNGFKVLVQESDGKWRATTESFEVKPASTGIAYRASKQSEDKTQEMLKWGLCVPGVDEGDGWVRCELEAAMLASRAGPVELINVNKSEQGSPATDLQEEANEVEPLKTATPLSTMESMLQPEPLAGWAD